MKNKSLLYYFWSGAILLSLVLVLFALLFVSFRKSASNGGQASNIPVSASPAGSGSGSQSQGPDAVEPSPVAPTEPTARPNNGLSSPAKLPESEDMGQEYLDKWYFLGDSTTYGLSTYGCVESKRVWTGVSGTLTLPNWSFTNIKDYETGSEMSLTDICSAKKPEYLLITLGVNGVSFLDEDGFKTTYKAMVEAIQTATPDTKIVLGSIFPVATSYAHLDQINNTKITAANGWILNIAEEMDLRYLDVNAYLRDVNGNLPESYQSGDGMHLTPAAYQIVLNCVRTHKYE